MPKKPKQVSGKRFKNLVQQLSHKKGITSPKGLAAKMGRQSLGKAKFQRLAAKGRSKNK